jgi:hypothetical protein
MWTGFSWLGIRPIESFTIYILAPKLLGFVLNVYIMNTLSGLCVYCLVPAVVIGTRSGFSRFH